VDTLQFQVYGLNGAPIASGVPNFTINPNLTHYAAGATNRITQEVQPTQSPFPNGAAAQPLGFAQFSAAKGNEYAIAWNETVTDTTGTYDQVEFTEFLPGTGGVAGSRHTFQFAAGNVQSVRVQTTTINGQEVAFLEYGDATATHIVEYDANGNQLAAYTDPTNVTFSQFVPLGDGRFALGYRDIIDGNETGQFEFKILDFRTGGVNINDSALTDGNKQYVAGTQFKDTFTGENNTSNTYYYVGRNVTGTAVGGPQDTFNGGTGANAWNVAIFPDARSNYLITTLPGLPTTITNIGDPLHAGSLLATNVQELIFGNPATDPASNPGSLEVTNGTYVMLGLPNGGEPITIDAGATLELMTPDSGTVTFAGPNGTLQLDQPTTFTGQIAGLAVGDAIDLAGISVQSASISGSTLSITQTNNQTLSYQVSGALAGNDFVTASDGHGGSILRLAPIGYAWSSVLFPATTTNGTFLFQPVVQANPFQNFIVVGYAQTTNYDPANPSGPYTMTHLAAGFDPFWLPQQTDIQLAQGSVTLPARQSAIFPNVSTPNGVDAEGIVAYVGQDNGNEVIKQIVIGGGDNSGGGPTVGAPTVIENLGPNTTVYTLIESARTDNTTTVPPTLSTYADAWDQLTTSGAYSIGFQIFNADGTPASPVEQAFSAAGVIDVASEPAWMFHGGSGAYELAIAQHDNNANVDYLQFHGYAFNGLPGTSGNFTIGADLSHYGSGATNRITQQLQPSLGAFPGGPSKSLQFTQFSPATGNEYATAWSETVTDGTGTHDQVEFVVFRPGQGGGIVSRSTFQIANGNPQNIALNVTNDVAMLAYGDATATNLVEFDSGGHQLAALSQATNQTFGNFTSLGDGRYTVAYRLTDNTQTSQFRFDTFDFRTTGVNVDYSGLNDGREKYVAGTQFNDRFVGENGVVNEYYFVGQNGGGAGPADSFTGGDNGWNIALFSGARSNYAITTTTDNGNVVATITNTGDPQHSGTLTTTNVQELVFNPSGDPSLDGGIVVADAESTVVLLGRDTGAMPATIKAGGTLEINAPESGTVTFAGPTGTLQLDQPASFTGLVSGFGAQDVLDLVGISYGANTSLAYASNSGNTGGTL
ncbi:MAG: hypothetical protein QOG74_1167, partial [Alphaproteobacteria bacterium]|nr:hypothetical protein [Alphaproteobacteria bacterium]